jgi:serine/threonine protein kinase
MALAPGTILGQYEIRSPLGAGGMGEVYRANDTRLGREVAIKVLPESVSSDTYRLHRFEQEARAAAGLNHPNILAVYQMATHDGLSYMVTELLEGETLRERMRLGHLDSPCRVVRFWRSHLPNSGHFSLAPKCPSSAQNWWPGKGSTVP